MAIMSEYLQRTIRSRGQVRAVDMVAIVSAILSLLTFTLVLPLGLHLP